MSTFTFTVPGQPMSWNRSYRQRAVGVKDRFGRAVLRPDGRPKTHMGIYKTQDAQVYQDSVRMLARVAKPTGWAATQVIVGYDFQLARDIDCDNVMKMINDALAEAIGLNDRNFYPVVFSKTTGSKDPSVMVHVYDRDRFRVDVLEK